VRQSPFPPPRAGRCCCPPRPDTSTLEAIDLNSTMTTSAFHQSLPPFWVDKAISTQSLKDNILFPNVPVSCYAKPANKPLDKTPLDERWCDSSLQRSVSVSSRAEVTITHAPSTSNACEMHAQPVEKSIASLALRLRSRPASSSAFYEPILYSQSFLL
jgi:hypothetical protein